VAGLGLPLGVPFGALCRPGAGRVRRRRGAGTGRGPGRPALARSLMTIFSRTPVWR